jgi:restriction endonuclease S subunit
VLFVKVGNDGFNLGAQRRAVVNSDLPEATRLLRGWMTSPEKFEGDGVMAQAVERTRLAENGDFNLSGERYLVAKSSSSSYPMVPLSSVCKLIGGATPSKANEDYWTNGTFKWISSRHLDALGNVTGSDFITESAVAETSTGIAPAGSVILITRVSVGKFAFANEEYAINQDLTAVIPKDQTVLSSRFLFCIARQLATVIEANAQGIGVRGVTRAFVGDLQIPLPPLEVQNQIVAEIEGYQKIIDGARQVLDNYKPHIVVDPAWSIKTLGDACKAILTGPFGTALHESDYVAEGIPVINPKNIVDGQILREGAKAVSPGTRDKLQEFTVRENDIVIGRRGEMGRCAVVTAEMNGWLCGTGCFVIRLNEQCDTRFAHLQISSPAVKTYLEAQAVGVTMMNLNQGILSRLQFPLPDLPTQRAIVAEIEAEQALVNANRELMRRMEAKVKAAIDRVWGAA